MAENRRSREGVVARARRAIAGVVAPRSASPGIEGGLAALVTEAYDSIAILDAEGRYEEVLSRWPTLLGRPTEEYVGRDPLVEVHPDDLDPISRLLSSRESGRHILEVRVRGDDEGWMRVEITVMPLGRDAKHWLLARRIPVKAKNRLIRVAS